MTSRSFSHLLGIESARRRLAAAAACAAGLLCGPLAANTQTGTDITISDKDYLPAEGAWVVLATGYIQTSGAVNVTTGADAVYYATNRIVLSPGFRAEPGSRFQAAIDANLDGTPEWNPDPPKPPGPDTDGDGIPDDVEIQNGTDPNDALDPNPFPRGWPNTDANPALAVGSTAGELAVDKSGALTYSVPIWTTPGTAGMQPQVSLNYSSQAGAGVAGFGWSLSGVSAITRGPMTRAVDGVATKVNFTATDQFYLDGQRLILISGTHGQPNAQYRTELESFTEVVAMGTRGTGPARFRARTKAGLTIWFGSSVDNTTNDDATFDASGHTEPFSWNVSRIEDTKGNYMTFEYSEDNTNGEHHLTRINYSGHSGTPVVTPYASLRFEYEDRTDWSTGYAAGSPIASLKRLKTIKSYFGETVVRTYALNYTNRTTANKRNLLTSITETGYEGKAYPDLVFDYEAPTGGWEAQPTFATPYPLAKKDEALGAGLMDLNGDGYPDFVHKKVSNTGTLYDHALLNTPTGWQDSVANHLPGGASALAWDGRADAGARFADLDGDGRVDILFSYKNNNGVIDNYASRNLGDHWEGFDAARLPTDSSYPAGTVYISAHQQSDCGRRIVDVNGDGLPDIVWNREDTEKGCLINNSDGRFQSGGPFWVRDDRWAPPFPIVGEFSAGAQFIDVNADGRPDLVIHGLALSGIEIGIAINSPTGWGTNWSHPAIVSINTPYATYQANLGALGKYLPPTVFTKDSTGLTSVPMGTEVVDLNGDGLPDVIMSNPKLPTNVGSARAYLNTGDGWVQSTAYTPPASVALYGRADGNDVDQTGAALADLNGDGLPDLVVYRAGQTAFFYLNTGHGWGDPSTSYLDGVSLNIPYALANADPTIPTGTQFVDLNGDGIADILSNTGPAYFNLAKPTADRMVKVTNGFGVAASVTYAALTERNADGTPTVYAKQSNSAFPAADVTGPMQVVKTVEHDDGVGGKYPVNYFYGGLKSDALRGSLGFEMMKVTDGRTGIVAETHQAQVYPFIGMPVSSTATSGSVVLSETLVEYDKIPLNTNKTQFVFAKSSLTTTRDLNAAALSYIDTEVLPSDIDDYGNIKKISVASSTSPTSTDIFTKVTTNTYEAADEANWILGRLATTSVQSTGPIGYGSPIIRCSSFTYEPITGLMKTETVEPNDPTNTLKLSSTYDYDNFGNKTGVTMTGASVSVASNGDLSAGAQISRATTTQYTTNGRFPLYTKNATNTQYEYYAYSDELGVMKGLKGSNDLETTWRLDGFGRKTEEHRADGTTAFINYRWAGGAGVPTGAVYSVETVVTGGAPSLVFHDAFGRAMQSLAVNGSGKIAYQDTLYDRMGRVSAQSNPYFSGNVKYWSGATTFDLLNRPLSVITPDDENGSQTMTFTYDGLTTTSVDAKGRVAKTTKNSQGWTVSNVHSESTLGNAPATNVVYTYDALGNLKSTTAAGVLTTIDHDLRGRKIGMVDADMGSWSYRYSIFGELIWQKDPKGQITTMTYDVLGRMLTRTERNDANTADETTSWAYDTAPGKGVGKLASASSPGGYLETYVYDSFGRPATVWRTIPGDTYSALEPRYSVTQTYDSFGRPSKTIYPTGFQTQNFYNAAGFLKQVRRVDNAQNFVYWRADGYAAAGQIEGEILGNGLAIDRVYSSATGRLRTAAIGRFDETALFSVQYLQYTYDQVGNVMSRTDGPTARTESFGYDWLDRLTSHTLNGGTPVTVGYDAKGNITSKSDVGIYAYGTNAGPHAVTGISGGLLGSQTYQYDLNGNMTLGGGRAMTWTSFNQARRIQNTANTIFSEFTFGAAHERVKQVSHTGTTVYIGSLFEKVTTGTLVENKHYIYAPTGRIAVRVERSNSTAETNYFHTDGLGSITAVTNETGAIVTRFAFDAWGKRVDPSTNGVITSAIAGRFTRGYTDHEHLNDLGFVHMNGRVYDPAIGRFLTADPNVDGVESSGGFNRYSYVENNPLAATDPTGYFKLKDALKIAAVIVISIVTYNVVSAWMYTAGTAAVGSTAATAASGVLASSVTAGTISASTAGVLAAGIGGAAGGFASSFAGSLLNGGSVGDAFKAGVIGGIIGGISMGVGKYAIGHLPDSLSALSENSISAAATEGIVNGATAGALDTAFNGGNFGANVGRQALLTSVAYGAAESAQTLRHNISIPGRVDKFLAKHASELTTQQTNILSNVGRVFAAANSITPMATLLGAAIGGGVGYWIGGDSTAASLGALIGGGLGFYGSGIKVRGSITTNAAAGSTWDGVVRGFANMYDMNIPITNSGSPTLPIKTSVDLSGAPMIFGIRINAYAFNANANLFLGGPSIADYNWNYALGKGAYKTTSPDWFFYRGGR